MAESTAEKLSSDSEVYISADEGYVQYVRLPVSLLYNGEYVVLYNAHFSLGSVLTNRSWRVVMCVRRGKREKAWGKSR